jgi:chemotaxis protein histidine kinase CheA
MFQMNSVTKTNADRSLLELFRSEVESHTTALTEGLLAMENDAKAVDLHIEAMMRAAHSIKGGARIVESDAAVQLAHNLEDCFVAVQKGSLVLQPAHIDVFLRASDMLGVLADNALSGRKEWSDEQIDSLLAAIASISAGEFSPVSVKTIKSPEPVKSAEVPAAFVCEMRDLDAADELIASKLAVQIGTVTIAKNIVVNDFQNNNLINLPLEIAEQAWKEPFRKYFN